jgi:hypothetical protein
MTARGILEAALQEEKRWIKCRKGWISYDNQGYLRAYRVTATGHSAMTVDATELHEILRDLKTQLGGVVRS